MLVDTLIYVLIFASVYLAIGIIIATLLKDGDDVSVGESILSGIFWPVVVITFAVIAVMVVVTKIINIWRE